MDLTYSAEGWPLCPECREQLALSHNWRDGSAVYWCPHALYERVFCQPWGYVFPSGSIHTRLWAFREPPAAQGQAHGKRKGRVAA